MVLHVTTAILPANTNQLLFKATLSSIFLISSQYTAHWYHLKTVAKANNVHGNFLQSLKHIFNICETTVIGQEHQHYHDNLIYLLLLQIESP